MKEETKEKESGLVKIRAEIDREKTQFEKQNQNQRGQRTINKPPKKIRPIS